jgi:glycosyltransferase involved in cell wall biosynthesis
MISVIIATRDRASLLAETLDALQAQEYPPEAMEIVLVDNASTDDTPEVMARAERRGPVAIVSVREPRAGKSHALNTALSHARGDLLVFTDDDVLPSPRWIAAYVRAFGETGADYAAGRILPLWEATPPSWMSPSLYGVLAVPDGGAARLPLGKGVNEQIMPIGANMAVRRSVVDRIGGWNPTLGKLQGTLRTGEDHEFALRLMAARCRGVYEPDAWVRHRVPAERLELDYFRRWFYENGIIVAGLERDYPTTNRYVLNVPRYLWRRAAGDLAAVARGTLLRDRRRTTAARMRLGWFAGYVRARHAGRGLAPPDSSRATPLGRTSS